MQFLHAKQAKKSFLGTQGAYGGEPKMRLGCGYADVYHTHPKVQLVSDPLQQQHQAAEILTRTIVAGLLPFPAVPTAQEDFRAFSCAVRDVIDAVRDQVITEGEADALIGMLARQLATRRVDGAILQAATTRPADFSVLAGSK